MKILKIIGYVLIGLIAVIVILALIAPSEYKMERSIVIDAPKELVFMNVKYWNKWPAWSPWAEKDPTMKVTVKGTDGEIGSVYSWVGDPEITGSGEMTSTGITPNEELAYHLHFMVPYESESDGYTRLSDLPGGKTKAVWGFYGENSFPFNIVMLFMSMEDMMAPDFDRGLTLLKNISEEQAEKVSKYKVEKAEWPGKKFATMRETVAMKDLAGYFGTSYQQIGIKAQESKARMTGMPCALYYSWDEQTAQTDVAAAMPVNRTVIGEQIEMVEIEKQTAYIVDYYGPYDGLASAHMALGLYMAKNKIEPAFPCLEEYATDPGAEPDPGKWLTRVYYFSKN